MELHLHIGMNKTASSYLQTMQTQNRVLLAKEGIYVPSSQWDGDMQNGVITPGNGHELARILCLPKNLKEQLLVYLQKLKTAAERNKCDKIALSNEILIRLFSNKDLLSSLSEAAKIAGITKIKMFCILRNPYEHALSLYKHRMKSGNVREYAEWMQNDYKTLFLFDLFLAHYKEFENIEWLFCPYKKDSVFLAKSYFNRFLDLKTQVTDKLTKSVNPSMSLKGIKIMSIMNNALPGAGRNFYRHCIDSDVKIGESPFLENKFFETYHSHILALFPNSIDRIANLLPLEDRLKFKEFPKNKSSAQKNETENILSIQAEEIQAICETLLNTKNQEFRNGLRKFVVKWKLKIVRRNNNFDSSRYGGSLRT